LRPSRIPISASVVLSESERRKTRWQLRAPDAIFSSEIFVLKEQFLVDQAVGQQADPAILFHADGL
jgi:hypothetical protein